MSIADTLSSIETNLGNAYTALSSKGATIPANKNIQNLATSINSVPQAAGFLKGTYQSVDTSSNLQYYITNTSAVTFTTRLYEILEIGTSVPRCSDSNLYTTSFADVSVGYIDYTTHNFVSYGTGSRSSSSLSFTPNNSVAIPMYSFVIMKDNTTSKLYLVCLYYEGTTTISLTTSSISSSTTQRYGRTYAHSKTLTYSSGDGTKLGISYPCFKFTSSGLAATLETFGITIS